MGADMVMSADDARLAVVAILDVDNDPMTDMTESDMLFMLDDQEPEQADPFDMPNDFNSFELHLFELFELFELFSFSPGLRFAFVVDVASGT